MDIIKLTPHQTLRNTRLASCRAKIAEKETKFNQKTADYYAKITNPSTTHGEVKAAHEERKSQWNDFIKLAKQKGELQLRTQVSIDKFVPKNN